MKINLKAVSVWIVLAVVLASYSAISELTYQNPRSPFGIPSQRIITGFIDDATIANVQEMVQWRLKPTGTNVSLVDSWVAISSQTGGRLRGDALSVRMHNNNSNPASDCEFSVHMYPIDDSPVFVPGTKGPQASATLCGGKIQLGALSDNSGENGIGDNTLTLRYDGYTVPLTGCECPIVECKLIVVVADITPGVDVCTILQDTSVSLFVTELQ